MAKEKFDVPGVDVPDPDGDRLPERTFDEPKGTIHQDQYLTKFPEETALPPTENAIVSPTTKEENRGQDQGQKERKSAPTPGPAPSVQVERPGKGATGSQVP